MEFTGIDTSGTNGTGAVVQSAADSATSTTELTLELAAFGSPNNATFAAFAQPVNYNQTYWPYAMPGPGLGVPFFNVIDPGNRGVSNPDSGLIGLFQHTPNVAPSCAFHPPKADALGVACEIKAARAVAAEDPTPDPRKQQTVWLPLWVDD
jgi:hypothetical protein